MSSTDRFFSPAAAAVSAALLSSSFRGLRLLPLPLLPLLANAEFAPEDLQTFAGLLPANCKGNASALIDCFVGGIPSGCAACFEESFESTALPETLPSTCDEATNDGFLGTVCDLQTCCVQCAEEISGAWWCTIEGENILDDGDAATTTGQLCGLDCPSNAEDPSDPTRGLIPEFISLPMKCIPKVVVWAACLDELTLDDAKECSACIAAKAKELEDKFPEGPGNMTQEDLCAAATDLLCTVGECCSQCGDDAAAVRDCIGDNGLGGRDSVPMISCGMQCEVPPTNTTTTVPPASTGGVDPIFVESIPTTNCSSEVTAFTNCMLNQAPADLIPCVSCVNATAREVAEKYPDPPQNAEEACAVATDLLCGLRGCCPGCGEQYSALETCIANNVDEGGGGVCSIKCPGGGGCSLAVSATAAAATAIGLTVNIL